MTKVCAFPRFRGSSFTTPYELRLALCVCRTCLDSSLCSFAMPAVRGPAGIFSPLMREYLPLALQRACKCSLSCIPGIVRLPTPCIVTLYWNSVPSQGVLRGYDPFMNLVLDETTDPASSDKKMGMIIVRGNSVVQFEILDPLRF